MKGRAALLALLAALVLGAAAPSVAVPAAIDTCAEGGDRGEAGEAGDCETGCALCYCCPRAPTSSAADLAFPAGEAPSAALEPEPPAQAPGPPARELSHVPWLRPA